MHPNLELSGLSVPSYLIFLTLGWTAGALIFYRAASREGLSAELTLAVMAGCALGASVGAWLMSALFVPWDELPRRLAEGSAFIGRTVVGGIAGGIAGVEVAKKLMGHTRSTGDAFALAIPPGHALGRIGCLLHGCCYGAPSALPWALRYPAGSYAHASQVASGRLAASAPASLPVHPAPLYELGFELALWALLLRSRRELRVHGNLFRLYLLAYASFRFVAEFARGDSAAPAGWALKPIQLVLLGAALIYGARLLRSERRARLAPTQ